MQKCHKFIIKELEFNAQGNNCFNIFGIKTILQGTEGTQSIPVLHMSKVHTLIHLTKMEAIHATNLKSRVQGFFYITCCTTHRLPNIRTSTATVRCIII